MDRRLNQNAAGTGSGQRRSRVWNRLIPALAVTLLMSMSAQARHHSRSHSDGESGQFDYFVLSLSWAPTYCLTHSDDGAECSGKGYGLVVHGLWPQYDAGGYPQQCSTQFDLSAAAASKGRTLYPSERLMQHEWQQHGTCSGLDALNYFQAVDKATAVVKVPQAMETPRAPQNQTAAQVVELFRRANPQMPDDGMVVACSRSDLSEVRVCLTRDLALRSCGRGVRTNCPQVPLNIPAPR
jgi:ribonuclease T2